jgi:hypothetical protein
MEQQTVFIHQPRTSQDLFGETKLTSFKYPLGKHSPNKRSPPIGLFRSRLFVDTDINQTKGCIAEDDESSNVLVPGATY